MFDKFRPINDRILVKRIAPDEKTASGIILATNEQEKGQTGYVISVGSGRRDKDGKQIPLVINQGDIVYFGKYSGTEAGTEYLIIKEDEILGVIEQ